MSDMKIKVILEEANVNKDFFTSNRKENKLKCPFCQQELREIYCYSVVVGYICPNPDCKKAEKLKGNAEFWQELIRTRKALDVAIDGLENIIDIEEGGSGSGFYTAVETLEQITALEQKDGK